MNRLMVGAVLAMAMSAVAAPPAPGAGPGLRQHGRFEDDADLGEHQEAAARRARTMSVVAIADALELGEADALKLAEKLRALDEKRVPIRRQMHEAMRAVKAAASGEQGALAQVDLNVQKVLDGRVQLAGLDKELFVVLARDLAPQQRAKLALVLAKMGQLHQGGRTGRR